MNYPKPYSSYKDSGVSWLGEVPEYWKILPGKACYVEMQVHNTGLKEKRVLSLSYGKIVVKNEEKLHGLVPASFETYQIIEPGDIIVRPTDLQNDWVSLRFGLSHHHGIITSAYLCFLTHKLLNNEYGHLLLHTYDLKKVFYGLGSGLRQNLDWNDFKYLPCVVPSIPEQITIVRYLNYMDKRINKYIKAKKKLIELLNEQKQAIIHQAVTRGLDPNVRLKPSGVEWLGEIPEHWEIRRLRNIIKGRLTYGANIAAEYFNTDWPRYLRITDFSKDGIIRTDTFRSLPPDIAKDYLVESGDILFARSGATVGKAFLVTTEAGTACHAGYLIRARPNQCLVIPEFLFAFTQSFAFQAWRDSIFIISTIQNISAEKYANLTIPIPSITEQKRILDLIKLQIQPINIAISRANREIDFLHEYSSRLIADVVTGKIDVRGVAAGLPDEIREDTTDNETELTVDSDLMEEENISASETDEE